MRVAAARVAAGVRHHLSLTLISLSVLRMEDDRALSRLVGEARPQGRTHWHLGPRFGEAQFFRHSVLKTRVNALMRSACDSLQLLQGIADNQPSGFMKPAISLTRSACRLVPVLSKTRCRCVFTVVSEMPSTGATSGTPPISTIAISTRISARVSW